MDAPTNAMTFNVLIKVEDGNFVAYCMELDIVAEASTLDMVKDEMGGLIAAAVDYAFSNDNMDHLYRPAPPEIWEEFYRCVESELEQIPIMGGFAPDRPLHSFVPPWIITKTCRSTNDCSV